MQTKLNSIIHECEKDTPGQNCIDCSCNERECLESLLNIYNSKFSERKNDFRFLKDIVEEFGGN